jgi:hypothetical protein
VPGAVSVVDDLLNIVDAHSPDFFHDPMGIPYVAVVDASRHEFFEIGSALFSQWLQRSAYLQQKLVTSDSDLKTALNLMSARARFDGPERRVFVRIGYHNEKVYLDLCDAKRRVVEIDEYGWRILDRAPVAFRRTDSMLALPEPVPGGSLEELRPLLNAGDDENWTLMCAFIVAQFMPAGALPIMAVQGRQGTAKSSTAKRLRSVFDPNAAPTRGRPRNVDDVMTAAYNNCVLSYDNISWGVKSWFSDVLCSLATGGGVSKRTLYTNYSETAMFARRSTILNGIDDLALRGDLAQRTLTINLTPIPFRSEMDLEADFREALPRILAALLDAVSTALGRLSDVKANHVWDDIRMADFAQWVVAAEAALPFEEGTFLKVYVEGQENQRIDMIEGNALAVALEALAQTMQVGVEGVYTTKELLNKLENLPTLTDKVRKARSYPRSVKGLSQFMRRDHEDLERATGLRITMDPNDRHPKTRLKQIRLVRVE